MISSCSTRNTIPVTKIWIQSIPIGQNHMWIFIHSFLESFKCQHCRKKKTNSTIQKIIITKDNSNASLLWMYTAVSQGKNTRRMKSNFRSQNFQVHQRTKNGKLCYMMISYHDTIHITLELKGDHWLIRTKRSSD